MLSQNGIDTQPINSDTRNTSSMNDNQDTETDGQAYQTECSYCGAVEGTYETEAEAEATANRVGVHDCKSCEHRTVLFVEEAE